MSSSSSEQSAESGLTCLARVGVDPHHDQDWSIRSLERTLGLYWLIPAHHGDTDQTGSLRSDDSRDGSVDTLTLASKHIGNLYTDDMTDILHSAVPGELFTLQYKEIDVINKTALLIHKQLRIQRGIGLYSPTEVSDVTQLPIN